LSTISLTKRRLLPALRYRSRFPELKSADDVWHYASPVHVLIEPPEGISTIEIAFDVAWDEEHTVGARIQEWRLVWLCGSV
jgi:hypothetical protein